MGTREPPGFVERIDDESREFHIHRGLETEVISCGTQTEFIHLREQLALDRVPFSVGGPIPGPAEDMKSAQQSGQLSVSFLSISWRGANQWVIHEIIPNALQWDLMEWQELQEREPIRLT